MTVQTSTDRSNGNLRGENTRRKLLDAALRLFADRGYSSVSTRELALAAGVNHAAIGFHFKGKSGLHAALMQEISNEFFALCQGFSEDITVMSASPVNQKQVFEQLRKALEKMVMRFGGSKRRRYMGALFAREHFDQSDAYQDIQARAGRVLLAALSKLVKSVHSEPAQARDLNIKTYCLLSLILSVSRDQSIILRDLGSEAYEPDNLNKLALYLADAACGILWPCTVN